MDMSFENIYDAIQAGNVSAVLKFLQQGVDLDRKNSQKLTPLLWAICANIDEKICIDIVKLLIKYGANVNLYCEGILPLYYAVFNEKEILVEIFLNAGAHFVNTKILHVAAERGNSKILQLLLDDKRCTREFINQVDDNGKTPVYIAASNGHKQCLKMLIQNGGALINNNVDNDNNDLYDIINIIFNEISQPADFFVDLLDSCVNEKKLSGEQIGNLMNKSLKSKIQYEKHYLVDFRMLSPGNGLRQMEVISQLLAVASYEEQTEIFQHPVIELYLRLKWSRICYFFYFWIATYIVFVLSLSIYTTLITHQYDVAYSARRYIRGMVIITSSGLLCHAILQCILTSKNHHQKYEMWLNLICTILTLVAIFSEPSGINWSLQNMPNWIQNITSLVVLFAWTELMLLIGRLPTFGYYALMFSAVLQNVIRVFLTFICLVVGFALSFSIQFHTYEQFKDPWRALVKTTVMMMGEFEYADLFTTTDDNHHSIHLSIVSRIIFLMFIILTSIVLMNLMIGLAVSDIQSLQKESHARKLEKQSDFIAQLEKVITSKHLKSKFIPRFVKRLLKKSYIDVIFDFNTSPQFRRSRKLPGKLIDSLVSVVKVHHTTNHKHI